MTEPPWRLPISAVSSNTVVDAGTRRLRLRKCHVTPRTSSVSVRWPDDCGTIGSSLKLEPTHDDLEEEDLEEDFFLAGMA